jgi:hypothetical protein
VWAWIFAGVTAQGQFAHIVASISAADVVPQSPEFWLSNLLVMLVPLWFAWRYQQKFAA